jgi:general control protein GCN4
VASYNNNHPQQSNPNTATSSSTGLFKRNPLQTRRVSEIIQGTGHPISASSFTNRFSSPQFYASAQPSSAPSLLQLQQQQSQQQQPRPQPPLFQNNSTGNIPNNHRQLYLNTLVDNQNQRRPATMTTADLEAMAAYLEMQPDLINPTEPMFDHEFNSVAALAASSVGSSTNNGTVSPKDLTMPSAPNSSALTAYTSPSIFDSPLESFESSPLYGNADGDLSFGNEWYPLFGGSGDDGSPPVKPEDLIMPHSGHHRSSASIDVSPSQSPDMQRPSLSGAARKHSSSNGVTSGTKKRHSRRDSLAPIVVADPADTIAIKRARNTMAARKSRARKEARVEELEKKVEELENQVEYWKNVAVSGKN